MADTVARAFEIARAGTCETVTDIRRQLSREGYSEVDEHLSIASLMRQLKALIRASKNTV